MLRGRGGRDRDRGACAEVSHAPARGFARIQDGRARRRREPEQHRGEGEAAGKTPRGGEMGSNGLTLDADAASLIAEGPAAFAASVVQLLRVSADRARLGRAAHALAVHCAALLDRDRLVRAVAAGRVRYHLRRHR